MKLYAPVYRFICATIVTFSWAYAYDDYHFYRASYFFGEPRFEKNWLSTVEAWVAAGTANRSIDSFCGRTTCLFDLYGPNNMRVLGNGVACKDPSNAADLALINLSRVPANSCFAQLSFPAHFRIAEIILQAYQNFGVGFFGQIQFPIRSMKVSNIGIRDLSPANTDCCPNKFAPEWQNFLQNFPAILQRYCLRFGGTNRTGIGDTTFLIGWTKNYQETEFLDFIDTTVRVGVLVPTAKEKNENLIFDIPFGYDGHYGFPISADMSFGAYDWMTIGAHGGVLLFLDHTKNKRIKTDINQSGMIKLATFPVVVNQGPIWDIGAFFKADHVCGKYSFIVGYSFVNKACDTLCPKPCTFSPCTLFDSHIVNSDQQLKGWTMHTVNLLFDADFTRECCMFCPRVSLIINIPVGGTRIFKTTMFGAILGLDIAWQL